MAFATAAFEGDKASQYPPSVVWAAAGSAAHSRIVVNKITRDMGGL
jgi:hypothetical protein